MLPNEPAGHRVSLVSVGGACRCTSACWLDALALKVCERFRVRWCNVCSRVLLRNKALMKFGGNSSASRLYSRQQVCFCLRTNQDKHCQHLTAGPQKSSFPQVYCSTWRTWIILLELKENWTLFLAQSDSKWALDLTADWSLSGALNVSNKRI